MAKASKSKIKRKPFSVTITINNNSEFFNYIQSFTRNHPGGGALMTFKNSNWLCQLLLQGSLFFKISHLIHRYSGGYRLYPDTKETMSKSKCLILII